jgi:general secretion pathway protein K
MTGHHRGRPREAGFALLIVVWTLALLTLLTTALTASGRSEVKLAENLRNAALAEAAADGAAAEAIFRLVAGQWAPGPHPYGVRIGGAVVTVRIEDAASLVNPNNAPRALMAALLRSVGADPQTAQTLAAAIENYRTAGGADASAYVAAGLPYGPAGRNFRDVAELRLVAGMTPALYARLAPHLSVAKLPVVVPDAADPVVAAAFHEAGPNGGFRPDFPRPDLLRELDGLLVARVTAVAAAGGARFSRMAELRIFGQRGRAPRPPPYQIMSWIAAEQ